MEALELECPGQATDIDNEKRLTDMVGEGEEGEGGTNGESNMETYTLPYVKQPMKICCMTQGTQTRTL